MGNEYSENIVETVLNNFQKVEVVDPEGQGKPYFLAPHSLSVHDAEKYLARPRRIAQKISFADVGGFVAYVNKFKAANSCIFANTNSFQALLDYHAPDAPSWCEHRAEFAVSKTPEWNKWKSFQSYAFNQREFASLLESLLKTIKSPKAADLLGVIRQIRATVTSKYVSLVAEDGVNAELEFKKTTEVKGAGEHIELPKALTIQLQPYIGIDISIEMEVRLNYLVSEENNSVLFSYEILNFESEELRAFDILVEKIKESTKVESFKGASLTR